ncbi:MAG: helix-turn-helix domain-containing protein [Lachnospiraceae bacterium]|nr:helix-turn-helix domain-containing protein [Lachnospiraceae bacterium]
MENLKTGGGICKRRKELGLTQNQLARSLNISFQAVSKWENNSAYNALNVFFQNKVHGAGMVKICIFSIKKVQIFCKVCFGFI